MLARILILAVAVPLLDLMILIRIGASWGFWTAVGLVFVTAAAGALLARSQGAAVIRGIRTELSVGRPPSGRMLDGLLILIGGALLLLPGLLTDAAGLVLLLPFTRRRFRAALSRRFEKMVARGEVQVIGLIR